MGKDTHLINIYLRIHNKCPLTMDDLQYLAQYAPECFEKTCKNVIYNIPETKPILEPDSQQLPAVVPYAPDYQTQNINQVLKNLKRLELQDFPMENVNAEDVKSLLGNLYMEMLFPHNDKDSFFNLSNETERPSFDRKA